MKPPVVATKKDLIGRSFLSPHYMLNRAMRRFVQDLEAAEANYHTEVAAIRQNLGIPAVYSETSDVERYSSAIQVFAAMTIEAAISFYAVARFGGDQHDDHFRWVSPVKRMRKALRVGRQLTQTDEEILEVVKRIFDRRDIIVHPYAAESVGPSPGATYVPTRALPDESAASARAAVLDVDRFFELMQELDQPESMFFAIG